MADSAHRFDFLTLATKIVGNPLFNDEGEFSWSKFGKDVGQIVNNAPVFNCMLGPISKEIKVRKAIVRREKEDMSGTAQKPEEISQGQDDDKDGDEATNERLKVLHNKIMEVMPHADGTEGEQQVFDLFKLLVDPADNVQTIENIFDLSFLIKEKKVLTDFTVGEHGIRTPVVFGIDQNKMHESGLGTDKKQMILSVNMQDLSTFRKYLYPNYLPDGSGDVNALHRTDPLYDARDAAHSAALVSAVFR
eukprot:gene27263-33957_t